VLAILVDGLKCRTKFWKGTSQGPFQQSLGNLKKIFSSETTEPISTKLCWNDSWMALLPKLCLVILTYNQDGRQANVKKLIIMLIQFKFEHILA
jgi:hypothetical protein